MNLYLKLSFLEIIEGLLSDRAVNLAVCLMYTCVKVAMWGTCFLGMQTDGTGCASPRKVERLADSRVGGVVAGAAHTMAAASPGKSWEI